MNTPVPGTAEDNVMHGPTAAKRAGSDASGQYVTFLCADTEYGIPILKVQEIKRWEPVTRIPCTPDYLLGALNLRGAVVPVVDLRRILGLGESVFDAGTAVVLVHTRATSGPLMAGLVVDAVSEVYHIESDVIRAAPDVGAGAGDIRLTGVAALAGKMVLLLDVDPMIGSICRAAGAAPTDGASAASAAATAGEAGH